MYRVPELRRLSREHNAALTLVRDVRWARLSGELWLAERAAYELAAAWTSDFANHFADEERVLRPHFTDAERTEFDSQHAHLRAGFASLVATIVDRTADADQAGAVADALRAHVRWEEQTLYPALQARLQPEVWAKVGAELGL